MFGRKRVEKPAEPAAEPEDEIESVPEVSEESSVELKAEALAPKRTRGGMIKSAVGILVVTLIAAGGGIGLGVRTQATLERAIADRDATTPAQSPTATPKYTSDMVVKTIEAVITNLASPADTWVRLETAMVFKIGGLPNPDVAAAEIRQDEIAYLRTINIAQLEGPSALQHLREDLNERASLRTGGKVTELIIQTLIVQ
jgi:flagellar FliL protein